MTKHITIYLLYFGHVGSMTNYMATILIAVWSDVKSSQGQGQGQGQVKSSQGKARQGKANQVKSSQVKSNQIKSNQVK